MRPLLYCISYIGVCYLQLLYDFILASENDADCLHVKADFITLLTQMFGDDKIIVMHAISCVTCSVTTAVGDSTYVLAGPSGAGKTASLMEIFKSLLCMDENDGCLNNQLRWSFGAKGVEICEKILCHYHNKQLVYIAPDMTANTKSSDFLELRPYSNGSPFGSGAIYHTDMNFAFLLFTDHFVMFRNEYGVVRRLKCLVSSGIFVDTARW